MRATILRRGRLVIDSLPDPVPGPGQVLVRTPRAESAARICMS